MVGFVGPNRMDEARLTILSNLPYSTTVTSVAGKCHQCPTEDQGDVSSGGQLKLVLATDSSHELYFTNPEGKLVCSVNDWFTEYGDYSILLTTDGKTFFCLPTLKGFLPYDNSGVVPPVLLNLIIVFGVVGLILYMLGFASRSSASPVVSALQLFQRKSKRDEPLSVRIDVVAGGDDDGRDAPPSTSHKPTSSKFSLLSCLKEICTGGSESQENGRVQSLDIFRGITVLLMLFVNAGGGKYWYFKHSIWDGMTFAELPHPWFNWIMGVTIAVSGVGERRKSVSERLRRITCRTAKLFFLGLTVSSVAFTNDLDKIPILGVLQDLGILYFIVATLEVLLPNLVRRSKKMEFNLFVGRWTCAVLPTLIYLAIMFGLDVPECGRGYFGPGGKHMGWKYKTCTGGAAGYIDRHIFGNNHLAFSLPFQFVYQTSVLYDSYGTFCLLTQTTQVYLGVLAGHVLIQHRQERRTLLRKWLFMALVQLVIASILCNDITGCLMPLNRRLWSVNFVLLTSSLALLLLSALYVVVDVMGCWNGSPFHYPGTNSIAIYVGQLLARNVFPFAWKVKSDTHSHYVFMHLWQMLLWLFISVVLFRKKIFLHV